jgi:ubiquinone/menaquinone biosynthesis C-methylase UbiE
MTGIDRQSTRQFFDGVAAQWERLRQTLYGDGVRRAALTAARVEAGMLVADIGTGTGFLAAGALAIGARVIGIDASDEMLRQATEKLTGKDFQGRTGDVEKLPLGDGEVDAVVANMVLHHAPDPAAAVREMARVLKPGGRLVISDTDSHQEDWLREAHHDLWMGFDRVEVARWLFRAGLRNVIVRGTGEACCATESDRTAKITIFLACGIKPAGGGPHQPDTTA